MCLLLIAFGAVCVVYGIAMAVAYPAGGFWFVWVVVGAALAAVGAARRAGAWSQLPVGFRRAVYALGAAFALLVAIGCGLIVSAAAAVPEVGVDYVIVLGASLHADGSPKEALRYRLDAALAYLEENPDSICIVSGGQGSDEPCTEAYAMAEYLVEHGLDADRILLEERSTTTAQNLAYSRELMDSADASVVVVTNNFHVFRAVHLARGQGLANVSGLAAELKPIYVPQATLRECFAIAKDALVGNLG